MSPFDYPAFGDARGAMRTARQFSRAAGGVGRGVLDQLNAALGLAFGGETVTSGTYGDVGAVPVKKKMRWAGIGGPNVVSLHDGRASGASLHRHLLSADKGPIVPGSGTPGHRGSKRSRRDAWFGEMLDKHCPWTVSPMYMLAGRYVDTSLASRNIAAAGDEHCYLVGRSAFTWGRLLTCFPAIDYLGGAMPNCYTNANVDYLVNGLFAMPLGVNNSVAYSRTGLRTTDNPHVGRLTFNMSLEFQAFASTDESAGNLYLQSLCAQVHLVAFNKAYFYNATTSETFIRNLDAAQFELNQGFDSYVRDTLTRQATQAGTLTNPNNANMVEEREVLQDRPYKVKWSSPVIQCRSTGPQKKSVASGFDDILSSHYGPRIDFTDQVVEIDHAFQYQPAAAGNATLWRPAAFEGFNDVYHFIVVFSFDDAAGNDRSFVQAGTTPFAPVNDTNGFTIGSKTVEAAIPVVNHRVAYNYSFKN